MTEYEYLRELIALEIKQRTEEGCNTAGFASRLDGCNDTEALSALYGELTALPVDADFPYYEPDSLDEIIKASTGGANTVKADIDENRVLGAWLGRLIGCALGKPLVYLSTSW